MMSESLTKERNAYDQRATFDDDGRMLPTRARGFTFLNLIRRATTRKAPSLTTDGHVSGKTDKELEREKWYDRDRKKMHVDLAIERARYDKRKRDDDGNVLATKTDILGRFAASTTTRENDLNAHKTQREYEEGRRYGHDRRALRDDLKTEHVLTCFASRSLGTQVLPPMSSAALLHQQLLGPMIQTGTRLKKN